MDFKEVFPKRALIGMIHLAGDSHKNRITRALEELEIYANEGVDAAIIENYHGDAFQVEEVLQESMGNPIIRGVNILGDPYRALYMGRTFGAKFVQFDSVIGYSIAKDIHDMQRRRFPDICLLGGVRFKYQQPTGRTLEEDLEEGKNNCDAVVTTGDGTGIETPIVKLISFRKRLGDFPLVVGAGVTLDNMYEQMKICDAAIVGSYFKAGGNTRKPVDKFKVRDSVQAVRQLR